MATWPVPDWATNHRGDADTLNDRVTDPLNDLSDHTHTGAAGNGSAALAPASITMGAGILQQSKGANVTSANPLALPNPPLGNYFLVTGSISFASTTPTNIQAGTVIFLVFQSAITVTHHATTMILQTGASWAAPAGSLLMLISEGGGNWREVARWMGITLSDPTYASITMTGPIYQDQGANVASANSIALGADGDYFEITGSTQVNLINAASMRQAGSVVYLYMSTGLTLHHAQGSTGQLFLAGSVDFVATAGATIVLISTGTAWRELSRMLP